MYKRGLTLPESKPTHTASNHRTRSAGRKHLGAHLPAEVTSSVNKCTWRIVNSAPGEEAASKFRKRWYGYRTSDSKHTWSRSGMHTRRKAGEQLKMISASSIGWMSSVPTIAPTWRMISTTTGAPARWWDDQTSLIYAKRVHLSLPKQFRKYQTVYRTASRETVTKWHLTKIMAEWLQVGIE